MFLFVKTREEFAFLATKVVGRLGLNDNCYFPLIGKTTKKIN